MKSEYFNRGKLVLAFALMLFSAAAVADSDKLIPTWIDESADFTKYNKFLVKPLVIDDVKILRPPWAQDDPVEWTLEMEDLEGIQILFHDAMEDVLEGNDGYPVVYISGDDVLEVDVEIISIMPYVRPGSAGTSGGHEITTLGSGAVVGQAELRDSKTRRLLLLLEGERVAGKEYKAWTQENNIANLREMFTGFAMRLRNAMDQKHAE